ncbi:mannose-1-phosphate guanylyltransferase/mannose-6-phosphate isomerase [Paludibacterium paludis]|uniref:mannose-1-phosphate guanylyltransferase n=1 Tax=Paludibacterium paludis TaxID=1225769 RepID=A0A918UAZ4_9NEIS|nr:mannose-1-phosphate guanylyltransferase/mannose-6-phosphate isomerase [Paludibacterium paludis]GGY19227.1 GDP-mannose pyrophosphorylase [Paludibacterium paludis]
MTLIPIILGGGSGTRLWPLSRSGYPKQYLALHGDDSLLQQTALRAATLPGAIAPILITSEAQRFLAAEQLRSIGLAAGAIVLEPCARNTAPAVAVGALLALRQDPDAHILVLPSDHVIQNHEAFADAVSSALALSCAGRLVTFGIEPTAPETGYGYIRRGAPIAAAANGFAVDAFVEKPDRARAEAFLAEGHYAWNSGMFLFRAAAYLEELGRFEPAMLAAAELAVERGHEDLDFLRLDAEAFAASPSNSIDYAVMERTDRAAVVAARDLAWSDIGSWSSLSDISPADENGNTLIGDTLAENCRGTYLRAEHRMIAAIGVDDLIVVETADAVLVARKSDVQNVKTIVERLASAGRSEANLHRRVFRPWGSYEGLDDGERFQVKRIVVNPGASLSLQMHYHRAEHWIVVRGTARITNGEAVLLLTENQSTYIPLGTVHRLENPGKLPLELIEVQSGSYLGEDDIVRFEDSYGRTAR